MASKTSTADQTGLPRVECPTVGLMELMNTCWRQRHIVANSMLGRARGEISAKELNRQMKQLNSTARRFRTITRAAHELDSINEVTR